MTQRVCGKERLIDNRFECRWSQPLCAVLLALTLAAPEGATAGEIYKWVGEDGAVHFSTTPREGSEKPAPLPTLQRENINERIQSIKEKTPKSCVKHGGVDCKQGADGDGSVICLDGFRDAVMPFQFHCMESRLKIERIAHRGKNGEELTEKSTEEPTTVELTVRNFSDVPAVGVAVSLRPYGQRMELQATGPERVEPYAVGEYTADFHAPSRFTSPKRKTEYRAACTNCTGVATGKR